MDDVVSMENMKTAYKIIDNTIRDLDNKSVQMISIIGLMFTIQVTMLSNIVSLHGVVLLVFSLIAYFISAVLFIKSCMTNEHMFYPTNESVCYHYEYDVSMDDYVSGAIGDYDDVIEYNRELINKKGVNSKYAFYCFTLGLFLTLLTVGSTVIL